MGNSVFLDACCARSKPTSQISIDEDTTTTWRLLSLREMREQMHQIKAVSLKSQEYLEDRVQLYLKAFHISTDHLIRMVQSFVHELDVGLIAFQNHPNVWIPQECSFKMLDACITRLPDGHEQGIFYALDFGGTNFRAARIELFGNGKLSIHQRSESLMSHKENFSYMDQNTTAMQLFDFFANIVYELMESQNDLDRRNLQCAFTFSFPCNQKKIDSAILLNWTKGFETGKNTDDPVVGLDVAELMNVAFKRNKVPVHCNAILNDTVGTLLSCAFEIDRSLHPPCLVGMILGTGVNCCYFEGTAPQYGELPRTNIDCELDFKAVANRGFQQAEKMCSGAYLGEICRLTLVKIFQHKAPPLAWEIGSLPTECVAKIFNDRSKEFIVTQRVIEELWKAKMTSEDLKIIHQIATAVADRSAALAAVLIVGCAQKTGRLQTAFGGLSVGIDGSLYKCNSWYRQRVRHHIDSILGATVGSLIHLVLADDGSGKGAGLLAATIVASQNETLSYCNM